MARRDPQLPPEDARLTPEEAAAAIASCEGLVVKLADYWFRRAGHAGSFEDFRQAVLGGMCEAARRFDKRRATRFTTYAYRWASKWARQLAEQELAAGGAAGRPGVALPTRPASFSRLASESRGLDHDHAGLNGEWVPDRRPPEAHPLGGLWAELAAYLTPPELQAVTLRFREGLSVVEVGRRMDLDHRRPKVLLERAMAKLRRARPDLEDLLPG